jgi:hypothetical protein
VNVVADARIARRRFTGTSMNYRARGPAFSTPAPAGRGGSAEAGDD